MQKVKALQLKRCQSASPTSPPYLLVGGRSGVEWLPPWCLVLAIWCSMPRSLRTDMALRPAGVPASRTSNNAHMATLSATGANARQPAQPMPCKGRQAAAQQCRYGKYWCHSKAADPPHFAHQHIIAGPHDRANPCGHHKAQLIMSRLLHCSIIAGLHDRAALLDITSRS